MKNDVEIFLFGFAVGVASGALMLFLARLPSLVR